ncbi:outer membrane beta-barrel protein [candidate division KSB1 bacterium]|nr:outer membrane beta-barrel protein [candidate division KSB1 bacterium]
MKTKRFLFGLFVLLIAGNVFAQDARVLELYGGMLNPKDAPNSALFGFSYGISVDERVDLNVGAGLYRKKYEEITYHDPAYYEQISDIEATKDLEYVTTLLPISIGTKVRFPLQRGLNWAMGGGLSYQFLWNKETDYNFEEPKEEKRNYKGMGWQMTAGIEYLVGSRSSILLEAFYNNSKVTKDINESGSIWREVNLTGLGFRAGLRLEFY